MGSKREINQGKTDVTIKTTSSRINKAAARARRHRNATIMSVGLAFCVALVVVFRLILPAIALNDTSLLECPYKVHQHSDACYEEVVVYDENGEETGTEKVLVCGKADYVIHEHDENCYQNGRLVCNLPEVKEHIHTEDCYQEQTVLVCDKEGELDEDGNLHIHDDSCYEKQAVLTCGQQELHEHSKKCYDKEGKLICGLLELRVHQHGRECIVETTEDVVEESVAFDNKEEAPDIEVSTEDGVSNAVENPTEENQAESTETVKPDQTVDSTEEESVKPAQTFDGVSGSITVHVEAPEGAFAEGTTMKVASVDDDKTISAIEDTIKDDKNIDGTVQKVQAVDITFFDKDGKEVEPTVPVSVTMSSALVEKAKTDESTEIIAVHVDNDGQGQVVDGVEDEKDALVFEAESFSVYALVSYTVDFHWEVDGQMYDFSLPGGGFVSLEHLIEKLGIAESDESTENEKTPEVTGDTINEAIKLNEVEVSEATKKFVEDVESVEFSSPELVWVGKVEGNYTVGGLKEANALEVEYSADLTEKQIAEINSQTVEAGDWALISMQPFISEESLTITLKTGEVFQINVTDYQSITFSITVSPDGAGSVDRTSNTTKTNNAANNNTITATANTGYVFDHWEVNGNNATILDQSLVVISNEGRKCQAKANAIFIGEEANSVLTAVFKSTVQSYTISYTAEGSGTIDKTSGTSTDTTGATATPAEGYRFVGWRVNGTILYTGATFVPSLVSENTTVTAVFEEDNGEPNDDIDYFQKFYFFVNPTGVGNSIQMQDSTGTAKGSAAENTESATNTYENGKTTNNGNSIYYAKALSGSGYRFVNWTNSGKFYSSSTTIQPKGTETKSGMFTTDTFTANFVPNGQYLINLYTTEGGHIFGGLQTITTADLGSVTVRAVADTGYEFVKWIDSSGNTLTTDDVLKIYDSSTITQDTYVTAVFEANNDALITYVADPLRGTVTIDSEIAPVGGEAQGATAIPNEGYRFISWVDANGFNAGYWEEFAPWGSQVYNGAVYTALFEPDSYDHYIRMGVDDPEHGYIISPDYDNTVDDQIQSMYIKDNGTIPATIEAVAYEEFLFDHWEMNFQTITRTIDGEEVPLGSTIPANFDLSKYMYPYPEDPEHPEFFYSRDNYLIAYYVPNPNVKTHTIHYEVITSDGGSGGYITNTSDTYTGSKSGNIVGSIATAQNGYDFGGWIQFLDDDHTNFRVVSDNKHADFKPTRDQLKDVEDDVTFYAMFYKDKGTNGGYVGYNMNLSDVDVTWNGPHDWVIASGAGAPMYYSNTEYTNGSYIYLDNSYIPKADGYYFVGWFDKDRPGVRDATVYTHADLDSGKRITYPYSNNSRFTLEALWAGIKVNNLIVPYDGNSHTITASKDLVSGTLTETPRYKTEIENFMSDSTFVIGNISWQLYSDDGETLSAAGTGATFTKTEPGTYKVKVTVQATLKGVPVTLQKDAYLIIYPATVTINKIWVDWYNETGIRPDEDHFTVHLNQGTNINVSPAQATGRNNESEPIWIPEAADKWSKTYEDVLVRPNTTYGANDQTSNYYDYTADEIIPTYYDKISMTRTVSEDKLSTEITFVNRIKKHPITFIKHDEDDHTLNGAQFTITMLENARFDDPQAEDTDKQPNKTLTWDVTIGSQTVDLYEGFYQIDETVAPTNYAKIGTQYFTIKNGVVTLTDANKNPLGDTEAIMITNNGEDSSFIIKDGKGQEITLKKVGVNNTDQSGAQSNLGGAKFTIYEASGTNKDSKGDVLEIDETSLENLVSDNISGVFWSGTLPAGDYLIEETEAPPGYNTIGVLIKMTVDGNGVSLGYVGTAGASPYNNPTKEGDIWTVTLINTAGVELPSTGGPGTTALYLIGLLLISIAGAGMLLKQRNTL